ncbi:MAG: hypothetical protein WAM91_17465 [Candidatus Acidiferrales bacterium]
MTSPKMHKQAVAARDAHMALLDLKKVVDRAAKTAHAAELEAVSLAVRPSSGREIPASLSVAMEDLRALSFEPTLSQAREKLQMVLLCHQLTKEMGE